MGKYPRLSVASWDWVRPVCYFMIVGPVQRSLAARQQPQVGVAGGQPVQIERHLRRTKVENLEIVIKMNPNRGKVVQWCR
jgi:hypothetical protein